MKVLVMIPYTSEEDFKDACKHYQVEYTCVAERVDHDIYEINADGMTLIYLGHFWGMNAANRIYGNAFNKLKQ